MRQVIISSKPRVHDELKEIKAQAANRWINAVNADSPYGHWQYALVERVSDIGSVLAGIL